MKRWKNKTTFPPMNKKTLDRNRKIIEHMLEIGWMVNLEYINKINNEKRIPSDEVNFEQLIYGRIDNDHHLISKCGKYVVRIREDCADFWIKSPNWEKLAIDVPLSKYKLVENAISFGILTIQLNQKRSENE